MKANMTRPNIIDNARGDVHEIGQSERGKKENLLSGRTFCTPVTTWEPVIS